MKLAGKVAIVTGGGKGIGRHYTRALAREGASVVIAELDERAAIEGANELTSGGCKALAIVTDVSNESSVRDMVGRSVDTFGRIDVLVNNAAIFASVPAQHGPLEKISVTDWDRMFAVNVRGTWLCCREVLPVMRQNGGGSIINISSGTAWKGNANFLHYVTSKGAVAAMTRAIAREVGATSGIRVNTIAPGFTESETAVEAGMASSEARQGTLQARIMQRAEQPDDLVGPLIFLASDDSAFMTGQTLHVDGGSVLT